MSGDANRATTKRRAAIGLDKGKPLVPRVLEVRVPGVDVVVEMGGEAWRFVLVRDDPPLGVLSHAAQRPIHPDRHVVRQTPSYPAT